MKCIAITARTKCSDKIPEKIRYIYCKILHKKFDTGNVLIHVLKSVLRRLVPLRERTCLRTLWDSEASQLVLELPGENAKEFPKDYKIEFLFTNGNFRCVTGIFGTLWDSEASQYFLKQIWE